METHPGRRSNLGHFVLLGTHMFELRVTALGVTPWKCSSRCPQGCILALFLCSPSISAPSTLSPVWSELFSRDAAPAGAQHPQATPGSTAWGVG